MSLVDKIIVVVDDEPDTAEMFAEMLRLNGYKVHKSYGGAEAIEIIRQVRPDAVVLDLMMPVVSGVDVISMLSQDSQLARIPVIIVTARSKPPSVKMGPDAKNYVYLTKPVAYLDLKSAVDEAILAAQSNTSR